MRNTILAVFVLITVFACQAMGKDGPMECRAIWVARWSLTTPEDVKRIVEFSKKYNCNALFVQVRGRGDAFYNSHLEPRAEDLEEQPADFDPLAMLVEEGHKAGIQIHAWLNTHFTWGSSSKPKSPEHIVNKHPDWLMRTRDDLVTLTAAGQSEGAYTCPSNPEVKKHVEDCFLDVVKNYDADGVHFDFVRYPSTDYCYCDGCLARFKAEIDKTITPEEKLILDNFPERISYTLAFPKKWDEFRRQQITDLVEATYKAAHQIKPNIIVSAAVFPSYDDAYNHRFQDWKKWMKMGILDALCPMAYTTDTAVFETQIKDALSAANGRPVYAGIGSWRITPESTIEKVKDARKLGAQGVILFSFEGVASGGKEDYLTKLKQEVFQEPAQVRAITQGEGE